MGFVGFATVGVERLGRYTILRHLASGGMADVLLGRADGTDSHIAGFERHVVVKRIKSEHAKDKRFIQMFLDEARLAATLHHQNVVQVHDIGEVNGEYFFAMEYLHGEDLRKILGAVSKLKTHVPLANVIAIISAAAAGLHYAHERRGNDKKRLDIVHRDVSPSNIIVGYDGSVKVVDFGIAKATMRGAETRTGTLKGKVSYMSPEQCKGASAVDRRSDVYSLGVVLYELATTARLFKAESDYLVMDAIVNGKVLLPRVKRPDLPNDLSQIIMRALSVDPARRYQTADELRVALEQCAADAGIVVSTSALASHMHKLFGDKPEPWLDGSDRASGSDDLHSWSDLDQPGDDDETSLSDPPTSEQRKHSSIAPVNKARGSQPPLRAKSALSGSHDVIRTTSPSSSSGVPRKQASAPPLGELSKHQPASSVNDTRTSTRMAWEYQGQAPEVVPSQEMRKRTKALLLAGPIALAFGGIAVWRYLDHEAAPAVASNVAVAPAPAMTPAVTPDPMPTTPGPAPVISTPAATRAATSTPSTARGPARAPAPGSLTPALTPTPSPSANHAAAHVAEPTPEPAVAPPIIPAPVPVAPPPVAPAPAVEAAPAVTLLSAATVSLVAGDHAAQLAKCENQATLHGDVSISFAINAAGKVISSQLSSTIHNVKVAVCILTAVRSWQFPKPPSGAAKGVYTITYQ
jgi:serine/threonine protein kinase